MFRLSVCSRSRPAVFLEPTVEGGRSAVRQPRLNSIPMVATANAIVLCLGQLVLGEDVTNARIIDATGRPSNAGLLQVKTEFGFGTVWCERVESVAGTPAGVVKGWGVIAL